MSVEDVIKGTGGGTGDAALRPVRTATLSSLRTSVAGGAAAGLPSDSLDLSSNARPSQFHQNVRNRINTAIEATNVATSAVDEIGRILGGIEGIVEQTGSGDLPGPRVAKLEKEARGLRDEIVRVAHTPTSNGVKPLAGDTIRVELEETLGKALEIILPDEAKDAFGLKDINLSKKEFILETAAKIEKARQGIEKLRGSLDAGVDTLKGTVAALEVASQNLEASQSSVRDVDEALKLADSTNGGIRQDPGGAIASLGDISKQAQALLGD